MLNYLILKNAKKCLHEIISIISHADGKILLHFLIYKYTEHILIYL